MTRLLAVELRRLFSRQLVLLVMAAMLVVPVLALVGTWRSVQPLDPVEAAQAEEFYEQELANWEAHGPEMIAQCEEDEEREREATGQDVDFGCDQIEPPQREWFMRVVPTFEESMPLILGTMVWLVVLGGLLIGGTFTAAEHSTGSMGTWLTFEPRRLRVYASKVAAVAVGMVAPALLTFAALVAGSWAIHSAYDATGDTTSGVWASLGLMVLRLVGLAVMTGVVGAVLGFVLRHTAGVIGAAVGYAVAEAIAGGMLNALVPEVQRWLLLKNIEAWVYHGAPYYVPDCTIDSSGMMCETVERMLPFSHAAVYLLVLTVVLVLLGALVFRRRDIR